MKTVSVTDYTI